MMHKLVVKKPWCPFCGQTVAPAADLPNRKMTEFNVGRCQCGAVYSCDPTGHNIGAALVETLVYACGDNWDLAWELMPEDDYLTGRIENYDEVTHQVIDIKNIDGRPVRGVLYFVRLHADMSDLAKRLKDKKEARIPADTDVLPEPEKLMLEPALDKKRIRQKATKQVVREFVESGDIDALV